MRLYERYRENTESLGLVFERYHKLPAGINLLLALGLLIIIWFLSHRLEKEFDFIDSLLLTVAAFWIGICIVFLLSEWRLVIARDSIFILDGKNKRVRTWARTDIQQVILLHKSSHHEGIGCESFPWRVDFLTLRSCRSHSGLKFYSEKPAREMANRLSEVLKIPIKEEPC